MCRPLEIPVRINLPTKTLPVIPIVMKSAVFEFELISKIAVMSLFTDYVVADFAVNCPLDWANVNCNDIDQ